MALTADSPQDTLDRTVPRTITGRRKVALVGYTWSAAEAPYGDDAWEVHGMNDLWSLHRPGNINVADLIAAGKFHAWHHLHGPEAILENPGAKAWLTEDHGFPIYFLPGVAEQLGFEVPNARVFPKDELVARFVPYFTNTVSWQMALAITQLEGVDGAEIGIFGVDLAVASEFSAQRPSAEFFIGMAMGLGIPVRIPQTSDLLKSAVQYGDPDPLAAKLQQRLLELRSRRDHVAQVIEDHRLMYERIEGAIEDAQHWATVWHQPIKPNREIMNPPSDGIAPAMPSA